MTRPALTLALRLLTLGACAHLAKTAFSPLPPASANTQTPPPRVNGSVGAPEQPPPAQLAYGTSPAGPGWPGVTETAGGGVSLDFVDTDIREVVAQIIGNALHVDYTIGPAVKGTATFHTATPLLRSSLLPTPQVLLSENAAAMVEGDGPYRIVPVTEATNAGIAGSSTSAGGVVLPLRSASAEPLAKLLTRRRHRKDRRRTRRQRAADQRRTDRPQHVGDAGAELRRRCAGRPVLRAAAGADGRRQGFRLGDAGHVQAPERRARSPASCAWCRSGGSTAC